MRFWLIFGVVTAALFAQEWQTMTTLNGVDFTGLTPEKKTTALKALRTMGCTCGCDMKVAECRVKDPNCPRSKPLAGVIVDAVKAGKGSADAIEVAKASQWGHVVEHKLLDDPVKIEIRGAPTMGPANARITLVEFSDFQCPYCSKASTQIAEILKAYPNDVKLVFKQYPLDNHPQAMISAQASLAAYNQGKFWQLHDLMFANRTKLSPGAIHFWAQSIGLDMKKFDADLNSPTVKKQVLKDLEDGEKAGVEGTPTLYIDGQRYNGESLDLIKIKPVIDGELRKKK
jgi:protein-disulfide isomerase